MQHITVLETEAVASLNLKSDSVVIDATLGSGGHSRNILVHLNEDAHLIGLDADPTAIEANADLQSSFDTPITLVNDNFRNIDTVLNKLEIIDVNAILADLGWRMEQFDGSSGLERGFSFSSNEPLYMTFGHPNNHPFTAYDIVNDWAEEDIANVIYAYGEERFSRRIAKRIVSMRSEVPIETAVQLAEIVYQAVPVFYQKKRTHPATKTFQALRIAVNDEFDALQELIQKGFELLKPKGRLSIITFHSLEDRIVKHAFKNLAQEQRALLVNKKPIEPTREEQKNNPRSRSAKLRTIEKIL